jgi:hypothetical protein
VSSNAERVFEVALENAEPLEGRCTRQVRPKRQPPEGLWQRSTRALRCACARQRPRSPTKSWDQGYPRDKWPRHIGGGNLRGSADWAGARTECSR